MSLSVAAISGIVTAAAKYLAASKAGEKVSEAASAALVRVGEVVFTRLKETFTRRGDATKATRALDDLFNDPTDEDYRKKLEKELKAQSDSDAELRTLLAQLSAEVEKTQGAEAPRAGDSYVVRDHGRVYGPMGGTTHGGITYSFGQEDEPKP